MRASDGEVDLDSRHTSDYSGSASDDDDDGTQDDDGNVGAGSSAATPPPRGRARGAWRSLACIAVVASAVAAVTTGAALHLHAGGGPWLRPRPREPPVAAATDPVALSGSAPPDATAWTPGERARARARAHPDERFLLVMNVAEGMSSWYHALLEMMVLAGRLERTLVEPCVRDGRIVTCVPGKVVSVPYGVPELDGVAPSPAGAFVDALALPTLGDACDRASTPAAADAADGLPPAQPPPDDAADDGSAYPLRAYLNMSALLSLYDRWLPFDEWWALESTRDGDAEVTRRGATRLSAPLAYCAGKTGRPDERDPVCAHPTGPFRLAPFVFDRVVSQWGARDGEDGDADGEGDGDEGSDGRRRRRPRRRRRRRDDDDGRDGAAAAATAARPETQHLRAAVRRLRADSRRNMFLFNVWRGGVAPVDTFPSLPTFNPVHYAAVNAWVRRTMVGGSGGNGGPPPRYVAFQWRSETVPDTKLRACAAALAGVAHDVLEGVIASEAAGAAWMPHLPPPPPPLVAGGNGSGGAAPSPRPRGVLLSDMPAPNNRCKMWPVYDGSMRRENRAAMRDVLRLSGLAKYDASHPRLDAGVLAIRDFILGAQAEWLVTCHGRGPRDCRDCFRANSYFTKKLLDARRAAGRPSFTQWLTVTAADLVGHDAGDDRPARGAPVPPRARVTQRERRPRDPEGY